MATTPGSTRRDTHTTGSGNEPQDTAPLTPMQEPPGSMDRPIPRTSDDNDLNMSSNGTGRSTGNLGRTGVTDRGLSGFTTTFAIIAAVLVVAFLIAVFVNSNRTDVATTPSTSSETTGSTTPATPPATEPDTKGDTGTGTGSGTTAPANP